MSLSSHARTRFAPSPTGSMHIGNLRTALYAYLLAKHDEGTFILRIEDTDQERLVPGAVERIFATLSACGLQHDEGPDVGGPYAPYVQSERLQHYKPWAEKLVAEGKAYYCFCAKTATNDSESESLNQAPGSANYGYDRHCRDLPAAEVQAQLAAGTPYVIRQKMPLSGETAFDDAVYGRIVVNNKELEDQVLLKSDGYPTYNFANVIDDHAMGVTHVLRGSEYLSSTPKYNLLYEALGWPLPHYVHLPLIIGTDGKKLSKRHGATGYSELVAEGYLPAAIINYLAFLGWAPGQDTREIFSLSELTAVFTPEHISKAPAVFDYEKLAWYNSQYLRALSAPAFASLIEASIAQVFPRGLTQLPLLAEMLQARITKLSDIATQIQFLAEPSPFERELFTQMKQKLSPELAAEILAFLTSFLPSLQNSWERSCLHEQLLALSTSQGWKTGQIMGSIRLALSGQVITPGGAIEIMLLLGAEESLARLNNVLTALRGGL